jgi:hypothetical protein
MDSDVFGHTVVKGLTSDSGNTCVLRLEIREGQQTAGSRVGHISCSIACVVRILPENNYRL